MLKNPRFVFAVEHDGDVELFADDRSLPSNVTSTDVRRAKQQPGKMVTFRGEIQLGYLPVRAK